MDDDVRSALRAMVEEKHEKLLAIATEAIAANEALVRTVGDQDLEQLVRAFENVLTEALDGRDPVARRLVVETAVPAMLAQGVGVPDLVQVNAAFCVLLTELVADIPEPRRTHARVWLADFMGGYARETVSEALRA